jgi:hypothetical protein
VALLLAQEKLKIPAKQWRRKKCELKKRELLTHSNVAAV